MQRVQADLRQNIIQVDATNVYTSILDENKNLILTVDEKTRGEAARGSIHGNRAERSHEIVKTKPSNIHTKKGETGRQFPVRANYFKLQSQFKWEIFHYHVDFVPEVENVAFRNLLLNQQRNTLGGFLYDRGSSIFTARQLDNDQIEIITRDRDEKEILIKITRVGLISPLENRSIQVQNIIVKKSLKELKLQRIGRDFFDPQAKVCTKFERFLLNEYHLHDSSSHITIDHSFTHSYRQNRIKFGSNLTSSLILSVVLCGAIIQFDP